MANMKNKFYKYLSIHVHENKAKKKLKDLFNLIVLEICSFNIHKDGKRLP